MVFAGMFMGNNKISAAPPPPPPSTYNLFFEPFEVGPDAFEASINAFDIDSGPVPISREPVFVRDGIEEDSSSPAFGTGFAILGDPGLFEVIGAEFSDLKFIGDQWSCFIFNVTGDITVRLPIGAM